ncbi:uncharacterized protein MONOS_7689 [Monocercomonoides exilis]|uniref:uncharacterized protein n=1 Tax=Monocercomonoides exilis TaxID=2049356 RepID=UPI0035596E28|nr:hypothetical protein MONOS_7689 [Monocercomonoides exilis]|eukprot:MONOS_7689.1-p1 / transcript=MONOS_7689.1 / gene=MONOS_7689 / organism=Monocercomonoides_exilis_PA203 / gene_product=unspecified product / transcript_product=unspecified product / location=Mono_scaffold00269:40140-45878(-) / protein_length=1874 / sequence_SO=supercontig / SO=protein_coding / is_pseudo=false
MFIWVFMLIQMITLSFFRIDISTQKVNQISSFVCFPDGTSLSYMAGKRLPMVVMLICAILIILAVYVVIVAVFFRSIAGSQPWIINLLRWLIHFTFSILFIPIISISISTFDCIDFEGEMVHRASKLSCFKDSLTFCGLIMGIIGLAYFLLMSFLLNSMIFEHHPKHGGLWSSPNGMWQSIESSILYGCVFAMRVLFAWPFWRGVVTVGSSLVMVVYFVWKQPIYKLPGNLLKASTWCIFGCVRLCGEIGFVIEGATGVWAVSVALQVFGLIVGIVLSAVVLPKIGRKVRVGRYLLSATGNPLIDTHAENAASALPPMKKPERIEPSVRFVQVDSYRSLDHLSFVEFVYTQGIRANKNNGELYYLYAAFLQAYRKNFIKSQPLLRKARSLPLGFFLRFVLYCKSKECNTSEGGDANRGRISELTSLTFVSLMSKAENGYEKAVSALKEFFENITSSQPDYKAMLRLLNEIVKNEDVSRKSYEELMATHGQSTKVLRNYARLLLDIFHDEDTAEMILNRADQIEDDTSNSSEPSITTGFAADADILTSITEGDGTDQAKALGVPISSGSGNENGSGSGSGIESGEGSGKMARGEGEESGDEGFRTPKEGSDAIRQNKNEKNSNSADGSENLTPLSNENSDESLPKTANTQNTAAAPEAQWNQSTEELQRRKRVQNVKKKKQKRKRKKREALLSDMSMGAGSSANGEMEKQATYLTCTLATFSLISIAALVISLIVYLSMSDMYQRNLDTLREICDLSYYTARSGSLGYNYFIYDIRFHFADQTPADHWEPTLTQKHVLIDMLAENAESITTLLGNVHDTTSNMEPWETANINTYIFLFTTKNETQSDGSVEEVIKEKKQILSPSSMLEVMAKLSQVCRYLSNTDMLSRPSEPDYLNDIQYMAFNALVPVLDGAKRVIVSYYDLMNKNCDEIIMAFVLCIMLTVVPLTGIQTFLFVHFTRRSVRERKRAYHTMLDVPKIKMQGAIRRLLSEEDADDDYELSQLSPMHNALKQSESIISNDEEMWAGRQSMDSLDSVKSSEDINENNNVDLVAKFSNESVTMEALASSPQSQNINLRAQSSSLISFQQTPSFLDDEHSIHSTLHPNPVALLPNGITTQSQSFVGNVAQQPGMARVSSGFDHSFCTVVSYSQGLAESKGMAFNKVGQPLTVRTVQNLRDINTDSEIGTDVHVQRAKSAMLPTEHANLEGERTDGTNMMMKMNLREGGLGDGGSRYGGQQMSSLIEVGPSIGSPITQRSLNGQLPKLMLGNVNPQSPNIQGNDFIGSTQASLASHSIYPMNGSQFGSDLGTALLPTSSSSDGIQSGTLFTSLGMIPSDSAAKTVPWSNDTPNNITSPGLRMNTTSQQANEVQKTQQVNASPSAAQTNQWNNAAKQYFYDDEEMEKEKRLGIVRNAIDDTTWEESMEKEIERLEGAYKQLPSPVSRRIVVNIVLTLSLGLVVASSTVAVVCGYVINYKSTSANIILSGMRASILFQIQFLMMTILQPIPIIKTDQSVTFPRSLNPVMYNSSHCSGSKDVSRSLLVPMARYFEAIHLNCHFGDSDYSHADDDTYDLISVKRMGTDINYEMLLKPSSCYRKETDDCSTLDPYRMYGVKGKIYGLSSLIARLRVYVERISKMDLSIITPNVTEPHFIMTSLRNDIVGGINKMTDTILKTGKAEVDESKTVVSVVVGVFCALFIASFFGNSMSWVSENKFIRSVSFKLLKLLPIDANDKEVEMLPSMVTGNEKFDRGRELILDVTQQLITAMKQYEHVGVVSSIYEQLLTTVMAVFTEEEKEMEHLSYQGIEKHKHEHVLLRQRLTLIGDHILAKNEAASAIGKKRLISLFDMHFTDEDITFADTVYKLRENSTKQSEEGENL